MLYVLIALVVIVSIVVASAWIKNAGDRSSRLAEIREKWGKPTDDNRSLKLIAAYHNSKDNSTMLSDATVADLDLDNVFAFIDRTNSKPGQQYLYSKLHSRTSSAHETAGIDEQVNALPTDQSLLENFELKLSGLNNINAYYLPELFKVQPSLFDPLTTFYIRISGITIIALMILTAATHSQVYFLSILGMLLLNLGIHYSTKKKVLQYTHSIPQLVKLIGIAKWFRKQSHTPANDAVNEAINNASKLNKSLRYVSFSEGFNDPTDLTYAMFELIKIILVLEPLMFVSSLNRVNQYRTHIRMLFEYVAHIDFLISIRSVREGLPFYSKPEFTNDNELAVTDLYHPLVDGCIANSITTRADRGVLITGSNMSGKTTFIRSIAINALLAQTIFTSCSKSYRAPWLNIHTSIRISDDIEEHKSYFQAEALAVLDILKQCDADRPAKSLVIIDEIFRGTNTIERIAAAKAVLAYLTTNGNFVFVSTHDLELAELLGSDYTVYSFEETVTEGARLVFDYRMKAGLLKNKNGIAILRSLGYPQTVVDDAGNVSGQLREKYQL